MQRFLIVLALIGVAAPAAAQPTPWSPERITAGWVFTPSIVFGGVWDSNVTVRNEFNPAISELVGLVNPRGEIDFNGRRAKVSAGYSGTLETYRSLEELTRYDQRGRLQARYQMTPRLQFNTRQQLTLSPTTEQLELGGLPFTRVGSHMLDVWGGFVYDVSRRSTLTADYNFQWVDFDRPGDQAEFRFLQGGHSHSPMVELTYALAPRLDVGGRWNFRQTSIDGGEQIFKSQEALGIVKIELGPATTLRGQAGVAHVQMIRRNEVQTGPSFGGGVSHTRGRVTLDVGYERSFLPSFGFGGLTANEEFHSRVMVPFAQGRMFAAGSVAWRRSEPAVAQDLGIAKLDSYWVQSSFGYFAARWLRVEAFYAFNHQASSSPGTVDRTRVGVQFVTFKPVRIQ